MKTVRLAIISPSQNAYSETFIQAHKDLIDADVFYYYGGSIPSNLEGKGNINPALKKGINKLIGHFRNDDEWHLRKALSDSFMNENIEVVLAEYGVVANRILPTCKELNLPMIVHFHGYDATTYKVLELNNNYKEVFEYARSVVAVSKAMQEKLLSLGCPQDKLVLNPCGPNDKFHEVEPSAEEELLIGLGRFSDKKAPYYTILAFKEVVEEFPAAQLILAGDGVLRNTCLNLIKSHQLEKSVHLVGVITPDEFRSYLVRARAFVQHSITAENGDMEGTPVAVLEASSAGLAVVSTLHAGIPDVIIDGTTGLLVPEHDVAGMSQNMAAVLRDKAFAQKMGKAGKANVLENFSMKIHIDKLNELVQSALDR